MPDETLRVVMINPDVIVGLRVGVKRSTDQKGRQQRDYTQIKIVRRDRKIGNQIGGKPE